MKNVFLLISFFICFAARSENTHEIVGYAPRFVGEKVVLYTVQDYITMTRIKLAEGVVSPVDSLFHLPLNIQTTVKGIIQIDRTEAEIYLAPNTSYDVYFLKAVNQPDGFNVKKTELVYFNLDTTDINHRIIEYNSWFDMFVAYHSQTMGMHNFHMYLDTFKTDAANAYRHVKDEFFLTYVRYNLAEMDQTFNTKGQQRLNIFLNYINGFPVYVENDQYMRFVLRFYHEEFGDYVPDIEEKVFLALADSSPTKLMMALKMDLFLANPEIRELIMIDKLGKAFYSEPHFRGNILTILDSVSRFAVYKHSAVVARNVINYVTSIEPGFPAPQISLTAPDGSLITWRKYRGKFVYVNFFETWHEKSLAEMKIIRELRTKYDNDIAFLSICLDNKKENFDAFMKSNPEFNWDIIYTGKDEDIMQKFRIVATPAYFLIDQDGFIALAPAPSPSPDGEYESIDKTFFYIQEALHPKNPMNVGGK